MAGPVFLLHNGDHPTLNGFPGAMSLAEFAEYEAVNLTNCDREPIHIPGSVQPHGILLALAPDLTIEQISDTTQALLGIAPAELLGQSLATLLSADQIQTLQDCLLGSFETINPLHLNLTTANGVHTFDGIFHRSPQDKLILELEPSTAEDRKDFFSFYAITKGILSRMQQTRDLLGLCELIVHEIQQLTGFDRVMVYRFDPDGSGTVIAESCQPDLEPYLGLHYPDSDIPKQAKQLYVLNPLRLIPNAQYRPAELLTLPLTAQQPPLDLSLAILRSVSPIHIEYLSNMGVGASMSISLLKEGKLWGLIACHHQSNKFISYSTRTICEFLGQIMALEIGTKEDTQNLDYTLRLKAIQARFIERLTRAEDFSTALVKNREELLALTSAEGAAICADGFITTVGKTPPEAFIHDLLDWLRDRFQDHLFVTDALAEQYSPAQAYLSTASGVMALSITKVQKNYVLWFRPEQVQYVTWAGNPDKFKQVETDGSLTIFPRKSFEAWKQLVEGHSQPWQPCEIDGAIELRSAIVGIILRKADELAAINLELERSNSELDSFTYIASHDLKEPLRGIHNYSTFLLEDYAGQLDEDGINKLETLVRLSQRMEDLISALLRFSRLGRQELDLQPLDLNELVRTVSEVLHISNTDSNIEIRVPQALPTVRGDRVLIEEVLTNLIGNGLKYNDCDRKWVEIGTADLLDPTSDETPLQVIYVRDNGIGIRERHMDSIFRIFKRLHGPGKYGGGTGAGLTIVKKIVERHGGTIWVESLYGEGSTFYFTLPL
ncbi:MAG TPA: ATP-binding protein [Leptolyngbyaceae cyanobacterium]